ncbi:hypothetical protein [Ferruginibacter sp.]|nr:hypothetical protein [Ferruginibacter sp.]
MFKQILKTTLVPGSFDIVAACIQAYVTTETPPAIVLKYIASGVFGKSAFTGSYGIMAIGLFFHFAIVFACTAVFFLLYPKLKFLHHSVLLNSFLIALTAWTVTTQIIIPLSEIKPDIFDMKKEVIAASVLFLFVGLPVSLAAKKYYQDKVNEIS